MKIIVFDDDPTGSQTVNDCLLLLQWDYSTLLKGIKHNSNLLFILANTRSLSEKDAESRLIEICLNLSKVIKNENLQKKDFILVSRGDSTLRGHNYLEPDIINRFFGPYDATFHIPAFLEGDRKTINGIHYVNGIPADETNFAKDKIFGYSTSNIKDILHKKSSQKLDLQNIDNLLLKDLQTLDINKDNKVLKFLCDLKNNKHVIVDINEYKELDKFSSVIKLLLPKKKFLFRTAASFLSSISGRERNIHNKIDYLKVRRKDIYGKYLPGLIIIGSYVDISTEQLQYILKNKSIKGIKIDVLNFYAISSQVGCEENISDLHNQILCEIRNCFEKSFTPVLFTSREFISFQSKDEQIRLQNLLSLFIADLVSELKYQIGYLISKGGITSNTILKDGFKVEYVYLEGQICKGVSLVTIKLKKINEQISMVTFPGNFGDKKSLLEVWGKLENKKI